MGHTPRYGLIKRLQAELPRGQPFDLVSLAALGVTTQLAAKYARHNWLIRLGHGVYCFPGDPLTRDGCVAFLSRRVKGLHVGGKSALALFAVRHNLTVRDTLILWGDQRYVLPGWFTSRFPSRYQGAKLFDWADDTTATATLSSPAGTNDAVLAATPERATLEMLYEVGTDQGLEEARNIFAGLRNLRKDITGHVLEACTIVKAVRLFLTWARETKVLDVDTLSEHYRLRVGSESRWMSRLKNGTLLTLRQYG
ncbi:MAG: type IV toxin-antitoxin system AbiEi family antitoxin domain-containing protein [Planctomycetota bacterium]|nr:type IV toxin-antitoxin system AbiEi family antitoxin domain-containing protein [Planctomycetota bacterium]